MPFESPNHTQIPNDLFDLMLPDMGYAELKVTLAILRKTLGWQKHSDKISLSQLEKLTGLSRQGVIDGCALAEERGTVAKSTDGFMTEWVVNLVDQSKTKLVKQVDQTSQAGRPKLVKQVDTQKKRNKEKELAPQEKGRARPDERAILTAFCEESGIPEPQPSTTKENKTAAALWWQPVRRMCLLANGRGPDLARQAVRRLRKDRLTVSSPASIEKTFTALFSEAAAPAYGTREL